MDDSDDYFEDDDLVLDDATLAIIEQAESKFQESQRETLLPSRSPQPPPPKKQKTSHTWQNTGLRRHSTVESDGLPEVSVVGEGMYGLDRLGNRITAPVQPSNVTINAPPIRPVPVSVSRSSSGSSINQHRPTPAPTRRPSGPISNNVAPRAHAPVPGPSRASIQREPSVPQITQKLNGTSLSQVSLGKINRDLILEVELLKLQVQETERKQEDLKRRLQEVEDARLAKEGEVKILRTGIERTAQHHIDELEKLRAAKAAAEAKQVEVEKTLRGELDSLRTSYRFKNLGREADALRTPYTARAKRIEKQFPASPAPFPSQMQLRNGGSQIAGPSNLSQSPRNARFDTRSGSPEPSQRTRKQTPNGRTNKHPNLPNFEDAFQITSPLRSRLKSKDKGKEREQGRSATQLEAQAHDPDSMFDHGDPPSSPTTPLRPIKRLEFAIPDQPRSQHVSSSLPMPQHDMDNPFHDNEDVSMAIEADIPQASQQSITGEPDEAPAEESFELEYPDPKEELKRIILTHSIQDDSSRQLTFQRLLSSPLPPSTSDDQLSQYNTASRELLEMLGSIHKTADYETHLHTAATSLTRMSYILAVNASILPLVGLIHLIRTLLYSLPPFATSLLSVLLPQSTRAYDMLHDPQNPTASQDSDNLDDLPLPQPPLIMSVICKIILSLSSVDDVAKGSSLLLECLQLIETLCWAIPDDLTGCLAEIPKNHGVIMALISSTHTLSTLQRSIQMLTFLASHAELYKHFFSYPRSTQLSSTKQYRTIPHIEHLAGLLIDPERDGSQFDSLKDDIVGFFIALAISNNEAVSILNQSEKLIPCLVKYLSELSSAFWEEDTDILFSPERAAVVMRLINRMTSLLFYMVVTPSPKYDISRRLQYIHTRPFNGILSGFVVSVGRFAFADPPEWVTPDVMVMLEHTNDLAAILLEFVTTSPDLDLVWKVYQKRGNEGNWKHAEENEDEREARLAHPVPEDE